VARHAIRTYLDSGVLITAYNAAPELKEPALRVLEDPDRVFLCSPFVNLETTPKALFNKRHGEHRFYQRYFRRATMTNDLKLILGYGFREAAGAGVGPMDALHLAAAHLLKADEFITTEKPNKSIHRSSLVKIVYLFS
jgi:predicted nucleic acid-binding protein